MTEQQKQREERAREILRKYYTAVRPDSENYIIQAMLEFEEAGEWKAKYEKCIEIIKRFDAGIIGMYDL